MIGKSLLHAESYKKGIAFSTILNFGAKALTFFTNVIIAFYFGTRIGTDIHFYAVGTILSIAYLINGFATAVLIPESMRIRELFGIRRSQEFLNFFILLFSVICGIIVLCIVVATVPIFSTLSNYSFEILNKYKYLLLLSAILLPFNCLNTFLFEIFASYRYFTLPMVFSILASIFSICSVLIFNNILGVTCIITSLIVATSINVILQLYLMKVKCSWYFKLSTKDLSPKLWKNIIYSELGNVSTACTGYIPLYIVSSFSAGTNTALSYGRQVADLLNILFTNQIAAVSGIKLNELYAKQEFKQLNAVFISTSKFIIFLLIPLSIITFVYSEQIISILFQRGQFDRHSVHLSSMFLRYFSLSIGLIGIDLITTRIILASQKIKYSFWYQIATNAIQIAALFILRPFLEEKSIPVSILIKYGVNLFALWFFLARILPFINYISVVLYFFKVLTINCIIIFIIVWTKQYSGIQNQILQLVYGTSLYAFSIITISLIFNLNDDFTRIFNYTLSKILKNRFNYEKN